MPYFQTGGHDLYYRSAGRGKIALVLVHGYYQTGNQAFSPLITLLCDKYRLLVPDLPGHGLNPHLPPQFTTDSHAKQLIEFVRYAKKHYRCRKFYLLGHSYGAFTVLNVAAQAEREITGVVAISAVDDYTPYHRRLKGILRIPRLLSPIYYRMQALLGGFPYGDREQLYAAMPKALRPGRLSYAKKKHRTLSPANARHYMQAFLSARVNWPQHKLSVPLLLLYGERDMLTPATWAEKIAPHFYSSRVEIIAEAGHNAQLSSPRRVADAIRSFIHDNAQTKSKTPAAQSEKTLRQQKRK